MLLIVMHNRKDYLESLILLAKKEGITETTIVEKRNIGIRIIGDSASFIFSKGNLLSTYDKAFVAVLKDEEKIKRLLDLIKNDPILNMLNLEDKGFICTVPFQQIKDLELESAYVKSGRLRIKIGDCLREEQILFDLKSHTKEVLIKEIAGLLKDAKEITDFETFLKDVFEREKLATTGIGSEIAIPHARSDAVKDFVIAFGRAKEGVEFNSLDNKPVKLIFLMGTPKEKRLSAYLKILAHLSKLLGEEALRNSLFKASSPKEVINIFQKAES